MLNICKPSGTVSQLVDSASGIHARYSPYYIRRIRMDSKDPLYTFMQEQGVPHEEEKGTAGSVGILAFPIKSPSSAVCTDHFSAVQQLEIWLMYQRHWCEHKPSVTISVKDSEWMEVGAWVYKHFNEMSGVSFYPIQTVLSDRPTPYTKCTEEEYKEALNKMPTSIDWKLFKEYNDSTEGAQTLACSSGNCEI